ncbi:MAG: DNA-binding protein [Desulfobacter sp.]|nr:DNA-binding protein [Desulfobacter sp.]WDP86873.1 MAG: DNA-binding protein [Desulfobacter sp.]
MKYSQAKLGRVFVIRLEDGDIVHETIEQFARDQGIRAASLIVLGGADKGSTLVTGPENGRADLIVPKTRDLDNVHEAAGVGTLFPNEKGEPVLHMHMACGRGFSTLTGCIRGGVKVWQVMEVIVQELEDSTGVRQLDKVTGFELLIP